MATNFDDIFSAAKQPEQAAKQPQTKKPTSQSKPTPKELPPKPDPWAEMQPEEKAATIRLNVDIPIGLNDKLAERARTLRTSKSDLVRKLLEWALE